MKIKKKIMKWIFKNLLTPFIIFVIGFFGAELSRDFRENFSKGRIKIKFDNVDMSHKYDLILQNSKSQHLKYYKIFHSQWFQDGQKPPRTGSCFDGLLCQINRSLPQCGNCLYRW